VYSVFKANTTIAISWFSKTSEHFERYFIIIANFIDEFSFQGE